MKSSMLRNNCLIVCQHNVKLKIQVSSLGHPYHHNMEIIMLFELVWQYGTHE